MLKAKTPGAAFDFTTRNRRPPRDLVNSLLSFAYAILVKDCAPPGRRRLPSVRKYANMRLQELRMPRTHVVF
jgi:hypothetical protein